MGKHTSETVVVTRRRGAVAAGIVVALGVGAFGLTKFLPDEPGPQATAACTDPQPVSVVTTEDLLPQVIRAADRVPQTSSVCVDYQVRAKSSGDVADAIEDNSAVPDVWIPDSPLWVDNVNHQLGDGWVTAGQTLATSPVVLGVPTSLQGLPAIKKQTRWPTVLDNKIPLSTADPHDSTASLMAVVAADQTVKTKQEESGLLQAYLRLSRGLASSDGLYTTAGQPRDRARVFPLSEQQLRGYNDDHHAFALTALVPKEGAPQLAYTWVTPVRGTQAPQAALDALRAQLTSKQTQDELIAAGFRVPGRPAPADTGVAADVEMLAAPSPKQALGAQEAWANLKKDARMLVLLDVSGSMLEKVDANQNRIQLLGGMSLAALDALPLSTQLGAWAFSTNLDGKGKDYLPLAPGLQTIDDSKAGLAYKAMLRKKVYELPALAARNGDTGLYDTIAAAYAYVQSTYDPGYVNSVVVLTDGANDDPGGGLDLPTLLKRLRGLYQQDKPVKIVTVAMGTKADPQALKQIATTTDGLSYVAKDPRDVTSVFVDAFLRRGE